MGRRLHKQGFSLPEVLASILLLSMVLGVGLTSTRRSGQGDAKSMAFVLAENFRSARAAAMASGHPVAIGFPSNGQTQASCQSFYRLEGQVFPKVTQKKNFAEENPNIYFGFVHWPGLGAIEVKADSKGESFSLDTWEPPTSDPLLIFLPDGTTTCNRLKTAGNLFTVVVAEGLSAAATPGASPNSGVSFALSQAYRPQTVSISENGEISVVSGLPKGEALLASGPVPCSSVNAPNLDPAPTSRPDLLDVQTFPKPPDDTLGADATVSPSGNLSLVVTAWSPQGSDLFMDWSGDGTFSKSKGTALTWNAQEAHWVGRIEWRPALNSVVGSQAQLQVRVFDRFGNETQSSGKSNVTVAVTPEKSRIVYRTNQDVRQLYEDRGDDRQVESGSFRYPAWSPDRSKLLVVEGTRLRLAVPGVGIVKTVLEDPAGVTYPKWSPDGTKILYLSGTNLWVTDLEGTQKTDVAKLSPSDVLVGGFGWHPKGSKIIFGTRKRTSIWSGRSWTVDPDGQNKKLMANAATLYAAYSPVLPDGKVKIAFYGYSRTYNGIHVVDENFSETPERIHREFWTGLSSTTQMGWSHDGTKLSFYGGNRSGGWTVKVADIATKNVVSIPDTRATHTWGVWSPDSTKLVLNDSQGRLISVNDQGEDRIVLTEGRAYDPSWVR